MPWKRACRCGRRPATGRNECDRCRNRRREHLGPDYRRRALELRARASVCELCGQPPRLDDPLQVHHVWPGEIDSPLQVIHRSENNAIGGAREA